MRIFMWKAVDPKLMRKLITAVYEDRGQTEDVAALKRAADSKLPHLAERALGRPVAPEHMPALMPVLRRSWLPSLDRIELENLVYWVRASSAHLRQQPEPTRKAAMVEYLRELRNTVNAQRAFRKSFVSVHKRDNGKPRNAEGSTKVETVGPTDLVGYGVPSSRTPYPHQQLAWEALDRAWTARRPEARRGLVILPTGSGKTFTMVTWLLKQLQSDPGCKVLWIADQQQLLDQAAQAFVAGSEPLPEGFTRRLRTMHSQAGPATALADPELNVACITRQSLLAGSPVVLSDRLRAFASGTRLVVVVDEAHHAVSPTYQRLLVELESIAPNHMRVGLTATPWPSGQGLTRRLLELFPVEFAKADTSELIASDVLARPRFHAIETGYESDLTDAEVREARKYDLPASALKKFNDAQRNDSIVDVWSQRREIWGKSLVFACNIEHANALHKAFGEAKVNTLVLHSESEFERKPILETFSAWTEPGVLISVGMLNEGVDLPSARTAVLARPTASRVLLRQMVGRVLRGPAAGGEPIAHIVDMRDDWDAELDILSPVEVEDDPIPDDPNLGPEDRHPLPPIILADSGSEEPDRAVARSKPTASISPGEIPPREQAIVAMFSTQLSGYYDLEYRKIPVFDHTADRWVELIAATLNNNPLDGRVSNFFNDVRAPRPQARTISDLVEYVKSYSAAPTLIPFVSNASLESIASEVWDRQDLPQREVDEYLQKRHQTSLFQITMPDYDSFYGEVMKTVRQRPTGRKISPEDVGETRTDEPKKQLRKFKNRDIAPIARSSLRRGRALLGERVPELASQLDDAPPVSWTRRPVYGSLAYWVTRRMTTGVRVTEILVSSLLQAPKSQVSDELLEFLIWHELCHHILPGHGHDREFRRIEHLWPDTALRDFELDELSEAFELRRPSVKE